jgi:hypothetical protein
MPLRSFHLPPNLDSPARHAALEVIVRRSHRRNLITTGWIEDRFSQ